MAKATKFLNKEQVRVAMIERVNLNSPLDERHPRTYEGMDMSNMVEYPYMKTRAGALQCSEMPWDFAKKQKLWSAAGIFSTVVALGAKCKGF